MDLGLIMHKSATPSRECERVEAEKSLIYLFIEYGGK